MKSNTTGKLKDGDQCIVTAGTHAGKSGTVRDINTSKTGHITITVEQKNGVRFKTLGKSVTVLSAASNTAAISSHITAYNNALTPADAAICNLLSQEIHKHLKTAENKIWHRQPVWFLEGNPVVGYSKLKTCIRLLFWSGQSFDEPGLVNEGSFKAAEARYTDVAQVNMKDLKRWLQKCINIQWDYKNIVKRRGVLERLK